MAEADLLPASNLCKQGRLEEAEGRLHDLPEICRYTAILMELCPRRLAPDYTPRRGKGLLLV